MAEPKIIRCLIVDDEPLARSVLVDHCSKIDFIEVIDECKNALEANSVLTHQSVDLIFLDINMPHMSGIDFFKQLNPRPAVIFTTAYSDYALDGFELDAIDYMVKPINFTRFFKGANKALKWLGKEPEKVPNSSTDLNPLNEKPFLYFKTIDKIVRIHLQDIVAIESQGHYVKILLEGENHVIHESISELERRLPSSDFIRVHRSFIVALKHVKAFSSAFIETPAIKVPIGRSYKEQVNQRLKHE